MNSSNPEKSPASSMEVIQTLAWMDKNNFKPVALNYQSKAAIGRDYVDVDYKPPTDELWKNNRLGVGIVTGPTHNGPIDIDLDCKEATFFAPKFLPVTQAIFGRKSKPRSHYLYIVNTSSMDKTAYLDPTNKQTIVELRADGGHQTVMPGSLHQDTGELVEWDVYPFPDIPTVPEDQLVKAVKKIAVATLIARHMWLSGQRNEVLKHLAGTFYYLDWEEEETCDIIRAVMEWHDDVDRSRIPTIKATYKRAERGTKITGAGKLRQFLEEDSLVDRLLEWIGSPTINLLGEYNERFAVVNVEGKFRIADVDVQPGEAPILYQKDDFLNLMGADYVVIESKSVPKPRLWLSSNRRRSFKEMDYIPGVEDSGQILNLWTGWTIQPDPEAKCEAWLQLLKQIICGDDEELFTWMQMWFANIIREPRQKPLTAPVIIGRQGAGKSLLLSYFGMILGPSYTTVTDPEHIYGRFNRHLATTLLLHSEEALYGGEKKHRGIIKSLITDKFRMFEQKGIDARQIRNYIRLVLTSNEAHAAPAEAGDRRFTVIDMNNRIADTELIAAVLKEMDDRGPAGLFHHLLSIDYDRTTVRINIKNEALSVLKGINHTPIESWWYDTLSSGTLLPDYLNWAQLPDDERWPSIVSSKALYLAMSIHMRDQGVRVIPNDTSFAFHLCKFTGVKLNKAQHYFTNPQVDGLPQAVNLLGDRQRCIVNLPTLTECREAFILYSGQDIEWPDEIPEEDKPIYEQY